MIQVKEDVDLHELSLEIWMSVSGVEECFHKVHPHYPVTITAGRDGVHKQQSKHYEGNALDFRIWNLTANECVRIVEEIENCLGREYDVILHTNSHIHVEYDPKP